jgi:phytanoyl-CoA hydroxylase
LQLTKEQLEEFEKNGFLLLRSFVNKKRCDLIKDLAKVHLEYEVEPIETEYEYIGIEKPEYKSTIRRLRQVYDRDKVFKEWMQEPAMLPILKQILKEKPVLITAHHNSIMTKMPHSSTATEWHRDIRYWSYDSDNLVSVWLALDKENSQNGVLEFIPESHRIEFPKESFDEKSFFRDDIAINQKYIQNKTSFELEKGDVVLFHSKLLHRANANKSDKAKISFVYTVKGASVQALPNSRSASFKEIELE